MRRFPGVSVECFIFYFHTYVRFFVFHARSAARLIPDGRQLSYALRWEHRRQTQTTTAGVHRATSWLQCYTTCCIAHSCFSRTLGSVTEDRAGTVNYCLLCVTHATRSAGLLLCCAAAILASGSSSMAAVPLWQADERATVRTHLVLLSSFTYDMYYACCCCCCLALPCLLWSYTTRCIFLLLLPSISIPNHTLIMHQVKSITKNRLYKHNGGRTIQHRLLSGGSREGALRLLQGAERAAVVRVTSTCGAVL